MLCWYHCWYTIYVSQHRIVQDPRFKIKKISLITTHQKEYDIQHSHISINHRYQYKYNNMLSCSKGSWISRSIYGLLLCFIHGKIHFNRSAEGATEINNWKYHQNGIASYYISTERMGKQPPYSSERKHHACQSCLSLEGYVFVCVNTLRPGLNWRHFLDDIFRCIFLNKSVWILIKILI